MEKGEKAWELCCMALGGKDRGFASLRCCESGVSADCGEEDCCGWGNQCTTSMVESMWSVGESGARAYHVGGESVLSLKLVIVIIGLGLRGWI